MGEHYFKIKDLNLIAKINSHVSYIFHKGKGWVVDNDHLLMDRMMGYGDCSQFDYEDISKEDAENELGEKLS
jgi:hypothetical protein